MSEMIHNFRSYSELEEAVRPNLYQLVMMIIITNILISLKACVCVCVCMLLVCQQLQT
jgi:hypothetical protein